MRCNQPLCRHDPQQADVEHLTRLFCTIRYGNRPITAVVQHEIEAALRRVQASVSSSRIEKPSNAHASSSR